ncbi:MAG: TonB family protein [Candidatus Eisenbacteria bacterium]|nr:TonB family protein [Candidatus Eisenbacteria bacterium]
MMILLIGLINPVCLTMWGPRVQSTTDDHQREFEETDRRNHHRGLIALAALVVAALCVWLFLQPYFVLSRIRQAAERGDRDALAELIDFPALRGNLKASFNASAAQSMSDLNDNPFAGLGLLLAGAFIDRIVDTYVTPSGIALLTAGQRPDPDGSSPGPDSDRTVKVEQRYRSSSVFLAVVHADSSREADITFVLHRRGLGWVLTDIRLPTFGRGSQPNEDLSSVGGKRSSSRRTARPHDRSAQRGGDTSTPTDVPTVVRVEGTDEQVVVVPPTDDELPKFGDYVYVDDLPEAITRVPPVYPDLARGAGIDGTVLVQALVGKDGRVRDVRIQKSVPALDAAAVAAVKQWVFKPAQSEGRPVAVWVAVPVKFSLR